MTINNKVGRKSDFWNENNLNPLSRINWRASLVPAAAVIPAPIAYTKVVAVKKLVVEFLMEFACPVLTDCVASRRHLFRTISCRVFSYLASGCSSFTVSKIECSKQA